MKTHSLLLLLLSLAGPSTAQPVPERARLYLTAKGTPDRLSAKGVVPFREASAPAEASFTVFVDPSQRFQTIEGIGAALTDAAAETFARLPEARQQEFLDAHFDPVKGIGYSMARTHIHSCDFSSRSYTYVRDGDADLESFSVEPDLAYRVPFLRRVLSMQPDLKIFVSPWSPPAWMKSNQSMLHGGTLKPEFYASWALYFVRFVEAYAQLGIPIWGLTVQNEPAAAQIWESCLFSAEEERDFVRDHLGPRLHRAGLGNLKLMIWDHNRGLAYQRGATVLSDPDAARYVWGTAFHWYVGDMWENLARLHDAFPGKAVFFSEGCNYPFSWDTFEDWKWGENYGHSMIHDFNHWAAGWTDWNILLDESGGPNHVKNFCFAPVHADTRKGTLHYQNSYYYIGHFSKFVRPGAQRLACTTTQAELEATAFENPDGSRVAVLLNRTEKPMAAQLWLQQRAVPVTLPPHSIASLVW
jgi:glucosylceramidase